jgi:hypothetical protein
VASVEEAFRRLTIGDAHFITAVAAFHPPAQGLHRLDVCTEELLRIAALIALDAPASSYRTPVGSAQRAGARPDDLLAVLVAVAGTVGSARVVSAAPSIALAAGYDVEAALEQIDTDEADGDPRS